MCRQEIHRNLNTGSDVKNIMPQSGFDQSQPHTHTGSCAGITEHTHTHTHTLKVADGCALHTGRIAGTVWEKEGRGGTVAAGKKQKRKSAAQ